MAQKIAHSSGVKIAHKIHKFTPELWYFFSTFLLKLPIALGCVNYAKIPRRYRQKFLKTPDASAVK